MDTKVKVLQDQLDEVKTLLRALAQSTQVSSSATAPHVDDPPTNDPTTNDPPICDMWTFLLLNFFGLLYSYLEHGI